MPNHVSDSFWSTIEKNHITPIPRWRFILKQLTLWILVATLAIVSSLAGSVALYISLNHDFTITHDYTITLLHDYPLLISIIMSMPWSWLVLIVLFFLLVFTAVSRSKKGYSFGITRIVAGLLLAIIPITTVFYASGIGRSTHWYLSENYSEYYHLVNGNEQDWSHPDKGRLGGRIVNYNEKEQVMILKSFANELWQIDLKNAKVDSDTLLVAGNYVKVAGIQTTSNCFLAHTIHRRSDIIITDPELTKSR